MPRLSRKEASSPTTGILIFYLSLSWPVTAVSAVKNISYGIANQLGSLGFPEASGMGLFFALGVPVDIPDKSVSFSLYFEANYGLPIYGNSTYEEILYRERRRIDRRLIYEMLVHKLESFDFSGESCLLRMICEAAKQPLNSNGVLGDILQIVLTPSSSEDENLPYEIVEAEYVNDCTERYANCPKSPLELISRFASDD